MREITIDSSYFAIQFLNQLKKRIYLKFQLVLRQLELSKQIVFTYQDQLIWYIMQITILNIFLTSVLNQDDTVLIYSCFRFYIIDHLLKHCQIHVLYGKKKETKVIIMKISN
jgi:hypothetical protein